MSWRIVVVRSLAKLSYKNGYLLVRNEDLNMIHLDEVGVLILETTAITITGHLMVELLKKKISVILCDEKRIPIEQMITFAGSHNSSETIKSQMAWDDRRKDLLWKNIIKEKIRNQAILLKQLEMNTEYAMLLMYSEEVEDNDSSNREGIAAKVYFNALFGASFNRKENNSINAALNYGYTILNSAFTREINAKGYLSQLGIHHRSRFNHYNLSSDLMETYRFLVDALVVKNKDRELDNEYKSELVSVLNQRVMINGFKQYTTNAISIYVNSVFKSMNLNSAINVLHYRPLE